MWPAELRPRANCRGTIEIGEHKLAIDASAMLDFRRELAAVRLFSVLWSSAQRFSKDGRAAALRTPDLHRRQETSGGQYLIYFSAVRVTKRPLRADSVEKSFFADERKSLGLLMRFMRGDVRD